MASRKTKPQAQKSPLELTPAERKVVDKYLTAISQEKPSFRIKISTDADGNKKAELDESNNPIAHPVMMNAFGSTDPAFLDGIVAQVFKLNEFDENDEVGDERGINFMLSVIQRIEPRDQLEAMLATQMAAVHVTIMKLARHLPQFLAHQGIPERSFNKLTRTFAIQMEALMRYRTRAVQQVTHVSVAEGGQAIVGNVTQAPCEKLPEKKAAESSRAAFTGTNVVPMPIADEAKAHATVGRRRKLAK
jgi:hypothetical protein